MGKRRFGIGVNGGVGWWAPGLGAVVLVAACANLGTSPDASDAAAGDAPASEATAAAAAPRSTAAGSARAPAGPKRTTVTRIVEKVALYRVQRGDTLKRIAQAHGCTVQNLAAWNHLRAASRPRPGSTLRLVSRHAVTVQVVQGANLSAAEAAADAVIDEVERPAERVALAWPAQGKVVTAFEPGENRGIEIAGKPGEPVRAAADGRVMYAGTGLAQYGSLIIVEHNQDFLTAYAHNRRLLVKAGDVVRQGQQIAEMGNASSPRVEVMFELRHDGRPVDPLPYLPRTNG